MPEVQEYLKQHPDHAEGAFSFIEITRQKAFILDGKAPALPENGGIGLWFAPVDASHLIEGIGKDKFDSIIAPSLGALLVAFSQKANTLIVNRIGFPSRAQKSVNE